MIDLLNKEYYYIETDIDGMRYMHIEYYVWDAHEAGREVYDEEKKEYTDADIVVTDYTFCLIPINELIEAEDRWELINEYEGNVQQYEMEYTFEQLKKEFEDTVISNDTFFTAKPLDYNDITMDTPEGWYYYTV